MICFLCDLIYTLAVAVWIWHQGLLLVESSLVICSLINAWLDADA
jgi:hypothetical protein